MRVLHEAVYPARVDAVPQARRAAEQAARGAGMSESQLENLRAAVSEAVTNAVMHAYPDGSAQTFRVTVIQDGRREVHVVVRDEGGGLHPGPDSPGLGLGLPLVAQLSDGFTVSDGTGTGTEVSMRFNLDAGRRELMIETPTHTATSAIDKPSAEEHATLELVTELARTGSLHPLIARLRNGETGPESARDALQVLGEYDLSMFVQVTLDTLIEQDVEDPGLAVQPRREVREDDQADD